MAASLLAANRRKLVMDTPAAEGPDLDALLDGQRWSAEVSGERWSAEELLPRDGTGE